MKTSTFESKAYGKRENKVINIEGRIQFDLLQVSILYLFCFIICIIVTDFIS